MIDWLVTLVPWQQALVGTGFTYFMTALGAGLVFFFKTINGFVYPFSIHKFLFLLVKGVIIFKEHFGEWDYFFAIF